MIDKDKLLVRRLPTETVDLNGQGSVTVRGLTRSEVTVLGKLGDDLDAADVFIITAGMVDPELTEEEVRLWRGNAPASELNAVTDRIVALSGLGEGAQKSG